MTALFLTRFQAAQYITQHWGLPCSKKTLDKLACIGGGPRFVRSGARVLYAPADLDEWFRERTTGPITSTSSGLQMHFELPNEDLGDLEDFPADRYTGDDRFDEITRLLDEQVDRVAVAKITGKSIS